ncbi:Tudor-knot domain-containing protein [Parvicella tangerina]|nr:Tudor-knot domain-containing protein [Parvicella tangerina]
MKKLFWMLTLIIGLNAVVLSQSELKVGDKVEVNWLGKGTYYSGQIDQIEGEKYFIRYDDGDEEWTTSEFINVIPESAFNVGDRVEANWNNEGTYLPAIVKSVKGENFYLKYDDGNLEWTTADKIKAKEGSKCLDKTTKYKKGEKVDLLYNDKWYDATILEAKGDGEYKVHYDGWDSKWDEYVCNDRLQPRTEKEESTGPKGSASGSAASSSSSKEEVGKIRLRNNCSHATVMRVGEKDYTIDKFKYIDIQVDERVWISTLVDGKPTGKQLYFLETGVLEFYADCR